jgi:hypothetical protein
MVSGGQGGAITQNDARICAECGAIAATESARCNVCGTAYGPLTPTVPCPVPGRLWARVEIVLPCERCQTPLAQRPETVGVPAPCTHCGHSNTLDMGFWDEALHAIHAVVDLSFPDFQGMNAPLGAHNPFASLGLRESSVDLPNEMLPSQSPLRMRVSPGAPLCQRCRNPVSVRTTGPGRVTSHCARCDDREAFSVPDVVSARFPSLRALVAFAPEAALAQGRIEPWWLLIDGLSYMRTVVQNNKAEYERANAEHVARAQWEQQDRENREREARLRAEQSEKDRIEREKREREAHTNAERAQLESDLVAARTWAERERIERERLQSELQQLKESHAEQVAQFQQGAWQQSEQMRVAHEQALTTERQQRAAEAKTYEEKDASARKRFKLSMALWAVLFLAVLGDLAIFFLNR